MTPHRQIVLEALGHAPHSLPQLACEMHKRANVSVTSMYAVTRDVIADLMESKHIEQVGEGLNTCWRLSAKTPIDAKKDKWREPVLQPTKGK